MSRTDARYSCELISPVVEVHILVDLNPNIMVRDVKQMWNLLPTTECHTKGEVLFRLVELVELIHELITNPKTAIIWQYGNGGNMGPINQAESTKLPH